MTFLFLGALGIVLLAGAPIAAHLLRRQRVENVVFPPARLVQKSPPVSRSRRRIADPWLFLVRVVSVVFLALLGASPLLRCSGLSIGRKGGGSVALAIVLDDSESMLVQRPGGTRWQSAYSGAKQLVSGLRAGDSVTLVLAGKSPRVALAPTTDLAAVTSTLESLQPSHRGTDLEGSLELARTLLRGLPQNDKKIALLSDLADGQPQGSPIGNGGDIPIWIPLPDLGRGGQSCAVLRADRPHHGVTAHVACSTPEAATGRKIELFNGEKSIASADLRPLLRAEYTLEENLVEPAKLRVRLTPPDDLPADDETPVLETSEQQLVAVVEEGQARTTTGGPPAVEQALAAVDPTVQVRPLPLVPDRGEDLTTFAALFVEDPPGFTPETRRALADFVGAGGVVFLTLGPRAAAAPLGANFEPFFSGSVSWAPTGSGSLEEASAVLPEVVHAGLAENFHPKGRATLQRSPSEGVLLRWQDHEPWLVSRDLGRGKVYLALSPATPEQSDLPLRPGFLLLMEHFLSDARARHGASRTLAGETWSFEGATRIEARDPAGKLLPVKTDGRRKLVTPPILGRYDLLVDGEHSTRIAALAEHEVDLRQRAQAPLAKGEGVGDTRSQVDLSPFLALTLLGLLVVELTMRLFLGRNSPAPGSSAEGALAP